MIDTKQFKERLEEEEVKLEAELLSVGRRNPSNPNDWEAVPQGTGGEPDPVDAADLIAGFEDNTGIVKELETRFNDVLGALSRIENSTYGTCSVCGEEIEEARLVANPTAHTCLKHLN
jgi:RNA polymerase-binding transcription factor DksA